jgi:hypothetical protein
MLYNGRGSASAAGRALTIILYLKLFIRIDPGRIPPAARAFYPGRPRRADGSPGPKKLHFFVIFPKKLIKTIAKAIKTRYNIIDGGEGEPRPNTHSQKEGTKK